MLSVSVPAGAIFYGRTRRRLDVSFDGALRQETDKAAREAHELIGSGVTPRPVYEKRCDRCPLAGECLPKTIRRHKSVKKYLSGVGKEP